MAVLQLSSIKDTSLWQRLNQMPGTDKLIAETLAYNLTSICEKASQRMKIFPSLHYQYTLHDEVHLLRVTELMAKIMPSEVSDALNPVEIALLILAAHFHDQGMVLDKEDHEALETDSAYKIFSDNWELDHPNLQDVKKRLRDPYLSDDERTRCVRVEQELQTALFTDFGRTTHGQRSADFVRKNFSNDPQWFVQDTNLADMVAKLSLSHVRPASDLNGQNGFRVDEVVGTYKVNMVYLGLVLRLADILDLDRDRTPDSLYRTIDFRSKVSLEEWAKHRSVDGWVIEPNLIQFTMNCEHPEYQRAAYQFMGWINAELAAANDITRNFPVRAKNYKFALPLAVDSSRIHPKDGSYIYYDLEFSLSRNEIVNLLMTDQLYGSPSLCIRELVQNSMDALRHRKALHKRDSDTEWTSGKVEMWHGLDEYGHEVVHCNDNGIGMNRTIIQRFLTNVGRSYYRSPEWEQENASFKAANIDFEPCAQFGIGFMSCFMLGDRITIRTRRDNGPSKGYGEPLIVEINGLGGIVVIREGDSNQPIGTTIEITGRRKPRFFDEWNDKVRLITTLYGYVLNCEFPIEAKCEIDEIADVVSIPASYSPPRTFMEKANIKKCLTVEQSFSEIHPSLQACMRASFLVNEDEKFVLSNSEAKWIRNEEDKIYPFAIEMSDGSRLHTYDGDSDQPVALDGILVAGRPGREGKNYIAGKLGWRSTSIDVCHMSFVIDVRGKIKPPITPARIPPDNMMHPFGKGRKWEHIADFVKEAQGRIWEKVIRHCSDIEPERLWQLGMIYSRYASSIDFGWMRAQIIWDYLSVPLIDADGKPMWKQIKELPRLLPVRKVELQDAENNKEKNKFILRTDDDCYVGSYDKLTNWWQYNIQSTNQADIQNTVSSQLEWALEHLLILLSTLVIRDGLPHLQIFDPVEPNSLPNKYLLGSNFSGRIVAIPYGGEISDFLSVHSVFRSVNRQHPLVSVVLDARYVEQSSDIQQFSEAIMYCLSNPENEENLKNPPKQIRRWFREIGQRFKDIDWQNLNKSLSPPYKVRLIDGTELGVTKELLETWADAEPDPSDR